jgi:hypothetical protein
VFGNLQFIRAVVWFISLIGVAISADMALEDALVREKEKRVLKLIAEREEVNESLNSDASDAGAG